MATIRWIGNAQLEIQVVTIKIATYDVASTYELSTGGAKTVSVPGNTDVNTTASDLYDALVASTEAEFTELSYSLATDTITITGPDDGAVFTIVDNVVGGTGTITNTTVTAGTGPYDLANELNWSTSTLPINGDTVYFQNNDVPALYNLDTLALVTLAALYIDASYTGRIGLPNRNPAGYEEWRPQYLQVGATICRIGAGLGNGAGRLRIDNLAIATALEVVTTAGSLDQNLPALCWKGTNAGNTVEIKGGSFGAAVFGGETAVIGAGTYSGGNVLLGPGCTNTNQTIGDATIVQNTGCSGTVTMYGQGDVTLQGTTGISILNVYNGTYRYNSTGTATTVTVGGGGAGTIDCSGDGSSRTFTTTSIKAGGTIIDPLKTIVYTNGIGIAAGARQIQVT